MTQPAEQAAREIWYPEALIDSYLRDCERQAKADGFWSEDYYWLLVERGFRWRMEPIR